MCVLTAMSSLVLALKWMHLGDGDGSVFKSAWIWVWIPEPLWKLSIAMCVCNSAPDWGDCFITNRKILWLRIRDILFMILPLTSPGRTQQGICKSRFFTSLAWGGKKSTFNFSHLVGGGSGKIFQSHSGLLTSLFPPPPGVKETRAETLTSHHIIVSMGLSFNVKSFSKKSLVGCHQFQVQWIETQLSWMKY